MFDLVISENEEVGVLVQTGPIKDMKRACRRRALRAVRDDGHGVRDVPRELMRLNRRVVQDDEDEVLNARDLRRVFRQQMPEVISEAETLLALEYVRSTSMIPFVPCRPEDFEAFMATQTRTENGAPHRLKVGPSSSDHWAWTYHARVTNPRLAFARR